MPDGYSQIFRLRVFGPFGLLYYGSATLRRKIKSLPFLGLRPHALHPGAIQGKEGIKFCHLATLIEGGLEMEFNGLVDDDDESEGDEGERLRVPEGGVVTAAALPRKVPASLPSASK